MSKMAVEDITIESIKCVISKFYANADISQNLHEILSSFQKRRESWDICVEILRQNRELVCEGKADSILPMLIFCGTTLKAHAYEGFTSHLGESEGKNVKKLWVLYETSMDLFLSYRSGPNSLSIQLCSVAAVCVIFLFDPRQHELDLLLPSSLLKAIDGNVPQLMFLTHLAEEAFNENIKISLERRAAFVRCCAIFSPRIFRRLMCNSMTNGTEEKECDIIFIKSLSTWIGLHVNLLKKFGGTTRELTTAKDCECLYEDSLIAKIPPDDSVLIRNSLNTFVALRITTHLFDCTKRGILSSNRRITESAIEALQQLLSICQLGITNLLIRAGIKHRELPAKDKNWSRCCRIIAKTVPAVVTQTTLAYLEGISDVIQLFNDKVDYEDATNVMQLLIPFSCEHLPFLLHFTEESSVYANVLKICNYVNSLLFLSPITLRELCLDFWASFQGHLFFSDNGMSSKSYGFTKLKVVERLRPFYELFLQKLYQSSLVDLKIVSYVPFESYRTLCLESVREASLLTGPEYVLKLLKDDLEIVENEINWLLAERCAFFVSTVANRLVKGNNDIVNRVISFTTSVQKFRYLIESYEENFVIFVQKTIAGLIIWTSAYISAEWNLLMQTLQILLNYCLQHNSLCGFLTAKAIRALCLTMQIPQDDALLVLRRLAAKVSDRDCLLESRIEIIGAMSDILNTLCVEVRNKLKCDFMGAISIRFMRIMDSGNLEESICIPSDELRIFIVALLFIYFGCTNHGSSENFELDTTYEFDILERVKHMSEFWDYLSVALESLSTVMAESEAKKLENNDGKLVSTKETRLLGWLLANAKFGDTSQLSVIRTIISHKRFIINEELCTAAINTLLKINENVITLMSDFDALNDARMMPPTSLCMVLTCTRLAIENIEVAYRIFEWNKFAVLLTTIVRSLPMSAPEANTAAMSLLHGFIYWIRLNNYRKNKLNTEESQRIKMIGDTVKHILRISVDCVNYGKKASYTKHGTILGAIVVCILRSISENPCQMESWLQIVAQIFHIIISYTMTGASIIRIVIINMNLKDGKVLSNRILGAGGPRQIVQVLRGLAHNLKRNNCKPVVST